MTGRHNTNRAFSLVEVLLAIFILGIGVIAVAALFPAGIAQQRQSVDDIIGPIVANNALSIIRTKLSPDDFGTFEEFGVAAPLVTVEGDWPWMRPGTARDDIGTTPEADERGWYDVFSWSANGPPLNSTSEFGGVTYVDDNNFVAQEQLVGIPYNRVKHNTGEAPQITISQGSRYYPMAQQDEFVAFVSVNNPLPRPQYVWDCMFRRFQGRILVAIFVYRVTVPGGENITYRTPHINQNQPPLPVKRPLPAQTAWDAFGPDDQPRSGDEAFVLGTAGGTAYDAADEYESWQEPRQWLLDDNNNVHRVLSFTRADLSSPVEVELVRPIAQVPVVVNAGQTRSRVPTTYLPDAVLDIDGDPLGLADHNIIGTIFYIPAEIAPSAVDPPNSSPLLLTAVYVTVKEL